MDMRERGSLGWNAGLRVLASETGGGRFLFRCGDGEMG